MLDILEFIAWIWLAVTAHQYGKYQKRTGDQSLQGFIKFLKESYTKQQTPENKPKQEPHPGSDAHYAAWREEQLKKRKQSRE